MRASPISSGWAGAACDAALIASLAGPARPHSAAQAAAPPAAAEPRSAHMLQA
jgi:hypothetical protein